MKTHTTTIQKASTYKGKTTFHPCTVTINQAQLQALYWLSCNGRVTDEKIVAAGYTVNAFGNLCSKFGLVNAKPTWHIADAGRAVVMALFNKA